MGSLTLEVDRNETCTRIARHQSTATVAKGLSFRPVPHRVSCSKARLPLRDGTDLLEARSTALSKPPHHLIFQHFAASRPPSMQKPWSLACKLRLEARVCFAAEMNVSVTHEPRKSAASR